MRNRSYKYNRHNEPTTKNATPKVVAGVLTAIMVVATGVGAFMAFRPPQASAQDDVGDPVEEYTFVEPAAKHATTTTTFGSVSAATTPEAEPAPEPEASTEPEPEPVAEEALAPVETPTVEAAQPAYEEPVYEEPEYVPTEEPAPEPAPVECYEAPADPAPASEPVCEAPAPAPSNAGMNDNELNVAQDIFNRYNEWRASNGLPTTYWDNTCAEMAVNSAKGCAGNRKLIHRLGIPGDLQYHYSDILQYASWRITGTDAINRWSGSGGHAAQMRCTTAQGAACGVYEENGIYWVAIVYTFDGCNIG